MPDARLPLTALSFQILVSLAGSPRHGYGILADIEETSQKPFSSSTGTLYLALQRLEESGWIEEVEAPSAVDARRRYYRLTEAGRRVAEAESRRLDALVGLARRRQLLAEEP